jgi:hypothetical protein
MRVSALLVLALPLVTLSPLACKKSDDGSKSKAIDVDEVKKTMKSDVLPKVKAKLPKDLAKPLDFEVGMVADDRVVVVVPTGWKESVIKALEPKEDSFGTKMWVSSNCDGMCQAKDWEKVSQKVDVDGMKTSTYEVVSDEKIDDGRIVVTKDKSQTGDPIVRLVVLKWKKDAPRYFACRVELQGDWAQAQDAFLEACKGMEPVRWGNMN